MSQILQHYTPKEWKLVQGHEEHDHQVLPNRVRTPAPNSGSWWYQQRTPRCDGVKSAQHKRNLQAIKDVQLQRKMDSKKDEVEKVEQRKREQQLRAKCAHGVRATKAATLASPRRTAHIAVTVNAAEEENLAERSGRPETNVLIVSPSKQQHQTCSTPTVSPTKGEQPQPVSRLGGLTPSRANTVAGGGAKVHRVNLVPTPVKRVASVQSRRMTPSSTLVGALSGKHDGAVGGSGGVNAKKNEHNKKVMSRAGGTGAGGPKKKEVLVPMEPAVQQHTLSCLQQRVVELEEQLAHFPLALSVSSVRKKAEVESELRQLEKCLTIYKFPVVMKRHSDPVGSNPHLQRLTNGARPASAGAPTMKL